MKKEKPSERKKKESKAKEEMAFNGSGTVSGSAPSTANAASGGGGGGGGGNSGNQDGPLNKRLCTGKENNEAGLNNNRVSNKTNRNRFLVSHFQLFSLSPLPSWNCMYPHTIYKILSRTHHFTCYCN